MTVFAQPAGLITVGWTIFFHTDTLNSYLQSVPLLAANNVYSKFIRYIRFVFVIFTFSFTTNFVEL